MCFQTPGDPDDFEAIDTKFPIKKITRMNPGDFYFVVFIYVSNPVRAIYDIKFKIN